jgi:electron transfer flavoprotein alpha subunit
MANILFIAECSGGELKKYSRELASKAVELAGDGLVTGLVIGDGGGDLGGYGVGRVISIQTGEMPSLGGGAMGIALAEVVEGVNPDIVLATASDLGVDLMARAAMRIGVGLAQDCVAIDSSGDGLRVTRPIYAGNVLEDLVIESRPAMATLRPNLFPVPEAGGAGIKVERFEITSCDLGARVIEVVDEEAGMIDLAEADRVVSGGRAIGSAEGFEVIRELADALGAAVGASRAAVDAGSISHDHQVGQSGRIINPSLYIACGISGAIQHVAGMRTAKTIVAINKDPDALIFSKSDYGIIGDLFDVVPAITTSVKKMLSE